MYNGRVNGNERRKAIMAYIRQHFEANHYAPTYLEIARGLGFQSKNAVAHHLDILEAQGHITRRPRSPRSITITPWATNAMSQDHQRTNQRIRRNLIRR